VQSSDREKIFEEKGMKEEEEKEVLIDEEKSERVPRVIEQSARGGVYR